MTVDANCIHPSTHLPNRNTKKNTWRLNPTLAMFHISWQAPSPSKTSQWILLLGCCVLWWCFFGVWGGVGGRGRQRDCKGRWVIYWQWGNLGLPANRAKVLGRQISISADTVPALGRFYFGVRHLGVWFVYHLSLCPSPWCKFVLCCCVMRVCLCCVCMWCV